MPQSISHLELKKHHQMKRSERKKFHSSSTEISEETSFEENTRLYNRDKELVKDKSHKTTNKQQEKNSDENEEEKYLVHENINMYNDFLVNPGSRESTLPIHVL